MLLHNLGTERILTNSTSALATWRADGTLAVAVWNYSPPGSAGVRKQMELRFQHLTGTPRLKIRVVDAAHGSALAAWEAMGKPDFPTREQQRKLRDVASLPPPEMRVLTSPGGVVSTTLELQPHALVEVTR